jgi:hypothetical protein
MGSCIYMPGAEDIKAMQARPTPQIESTNDDMVRVTVGDQIGWVSSYHLVDPKIKQLQRAWLLKHGTNEQS